jgi:hypothetical protein
MNTQIRKATISDVEALITLSKRTIRASYRAFYDAQINYPTFSQINWSIHSQLILSESEESTRFRA